MTEKDVRQGTGYPVVVGESYIEEDEIDLIELWNVIWKRKIFIGGFTICCTLIAVIMVLFVMPVIYRSQTVIIPSSSESSSKLSGLLSSISLPINLGNIAGGNDKSNLILSFLNSRTLKLRLIEKYNLLPILYKDLWDSDKNMWKVKDKDKVPTPIKAIQDKALNDIYNVNQDKKTGLITISWESEDPKFACIMLNRVIKELSHYLNKEYETDAKRERIFVEKQLEKSKKELEYWEKQVPSKKYTLADINRELMASQTVYTELRKQYELAKIAEEKEIIDFKVLDPPFVPEIKYKPKRALICSITLVSSFFLSVFIVFFLEFISNARQRNLENEA